MKDKPLTVERLKELVRAQHDWIHVEGYVIHRADADDIERALDEYRELMEGPGIRSATATDSIFSPAHRIWGIACAIDRMDEAQLFFELSPLIRELKDIATSLRDDPSSAAKEPAMT